MAIVKIASTNVQFGRDLSMMVEDFVMVEIKTLEAFLN